MVGGLDVEQDEAYPGDAVGVAAHEIGKQRFDRQRRSCDPQKLQVAAAQLLGALVEDAGVAEHAAAVAQELFAARA